MKKIATLFIAVLLFISCGPKNEVYPTQYSEILQYADSFAVAHANIFDNRVVEDKADEEFKHYCKKNFSQDSISPTNGIKVTLKEIAHYSDLPKHEYRAWFDIEDETRNFIYDSDTHTYDYCITISALIPEDVAITLVEKNNYYVYGTAYNSELNQTGYGAMTYGLYDKKMLLFLGTWRIDNPVIIPVEE